ncbi:hypothetical protein CDEST_13518 [Colletotrichum destructivum]|uniref:Uncharacterized protein n=1 Tax=Colletotrichum destructivum TaxID=34406 RepID=A0AAX4IZ51_9PEZI|nr:hypothetical protein CDEST_13518 [Colletotrichum destructivum]
MMKVNKSDKECRLRAKTLGRDGSGRGIADCGNTDIACRRGSRRQKPRAVVVVVPCSSSIGRCRSSLPGLGNALDKADSAEQKVLGHGQSNGGENIASPSIHRFPPSLLPPIPAGPAPKPNMAAHIHIFPESNFAALALGLDPSSQTAAFRRERWTGSL